MLADRWFLDVSALPDLLWAQLVVHEDGLAEVRTAEDGPHRFVEPADAEAWLAGAHYRAFEDLLWEMAIAPDLRPPEAPVRQPAAGAELRCQRCHEPVKVHREEFARFERMHWLCFHLSFEHGAYDPDEPCEDPSCPWNRIKELQARLEQAERA
jgi:hypothetical protein